MTIPSGNSRSADRRWRWLHAGDDGGCSLRPASRQIEHHSYDNPTSQGDPQSTPRPIACPASSDRRRPIQSGDQPVTPKSP
jgi:hypothetical protein